MFNKGIFAAVGALFLATLYAIKRLFDSREEKAHKAEVANAAQSVADKGNAAGRASAEVAEKAAGTISKETADVQKAADADRVAVASGGLRVGSDTINDAINRANGGL